MLLLLILLFIFIIIIITILKNKEKIKFFLQKINFQKYIPFLIFILTILLIFLFFNPKSLLYQKIKLKLVQIKLKKETINLILETQQLDLKQEEDCYKICQLNKGNLNELKNNLENLKKNVNFKIYQKNDLEKLTNSDLLKLISNYGINYSLVASRIQLDFIENLKYKVQQKNEEQKY